MAKRKKDKSKRAKKAAIKKAIAVCQLTRKGKLKLSTCTKIRRGKRKKQPKAPEPLKVDFEAPRYPDFGRRRFSPRPYGRPYGEY